MKNISYPFVAAFVAAILSGCVDRANAPLLLPVGEPAQPPDVVEMLCVGDANAAYDRQKAEFDKRARMGRYGVMEGEAMQREGEAKRTARMTYISCASSQGYRAVYQ